MTFNQKVSSILIAVLLFVSVATIMGLNRTPAAAATLPGENGKIVFVSNRGNAEVYDIYTMNPDGSGVTRLTNGTFTFIDQSQWSPDGSKIAFVGKPVGSEPNDHEVFVMNADGSEITQISHVNDIVYDLQWSTDGKQIIFESSRDFESKMDNTQIFKVSADGSGGQVNLSNDIWTNYNARLSPDGTKIVFLSNRNGTELFLMNATDGTGVTQLTHGNKNPTAAVWSPDGSKIIFSDNGSQTHVMNADGTGLTSLWPNQMSINAVPAYSPDGAKVAFLSSRTDPSNPMHRISNLFAMNSDGSELTQLTNHTGNDGMISWSPDSTQLVFMTQRPDQPDAEIHKVDINAKGDINITNDPNASDIYPDWGAKAKTFAGPNGRIVFESQRDGNPEIYVMNADGSAQMRLTNNNSTDTSPRWSPDNSKIAFVSNRDGNNEIYVMNADGTGQVNISRNSTADDSSPSWSPDGKRLAFVRGGEIHVMDLDGTAQTRLTDGQRAQDVSWSPDGKKMAFTDLGNEEIISQKIFVMNPDGTGQVNISNSTSSTISDFHPNWSPDSSKITFTTNRGTACCVIFTMNADGSDKTRLTPGVGFDLSSSWSPDGKEIAFGGSYTGDDASAPTLEVYVVNADRSSNTPTRLTFNDAVDYYPDWGSAHDIKPPAHPTLGVRSGVQYHNQEFSGIWATIRSMNGTLLKSGYTPLTYVGNTGERYKVTVADYDGKVFDFWQDTTGDVRTRTVTLTSDVTLRAIYDLGDSLRGFTSLTYTGGEEAGQPNLTVNATLTNDTSKTLHMWMVIDPQSTNSSGTTYKVYATNGYQNLVFDHWGDNGSTDRIRTITIREATTITAYYKQGASTVSFSAHYHNVNGPGTPVCDDVISGSCGPFFGSAEKPGGGVTVTGGSWSQHMPRGALCSIGGPIGDMSTNGTTFTMTGTYTGTCDSFDPGSAVTVTGMCGANSEITFTIGGGAGNKFIGDSTCSA